MSKEIEITQEMLEQALLCCLDNEPADHYPCEDCYLYPLRGSDDDCMPDGTVCSKRLAQDAIAYISRINDFEKSQCKIMLEKLQRVKTENAQLRSVIEQMDPDFFKRKCRVCGCDWNHACPGGCSWVGDDLCSRCFSKMLGGKNDG
ncbi:hypothetical protein [Caproiciproducens sp.]